MTLEEIIANAQFGDDVAFDFNGNKVSLGDIRKFRSRLDEETKTATAKRVEAERLALESANLLSQLSEQARQLPTKPADKPPAADEWKTDPLYAPLLPLLNKYDETITKMNAALESQKKALDNAQAIYALERMRGQYDRSRDPKDGKVKGRTFEEMVQQAVQVKDIDGMGLPTLEKIIGTLTEPDRIEKSNQEAVAAARKQWEAEQKAASVPKPSGARFTTRTGEKPPISKIEDLTSELVANDPDVQAAMEGKVQ